jgi:hypothetical protein
MCSDKKLFNATPTVVTSPFLVNSFLDYGGLLGVSFVRRTKLSPGSAKLQTRIYQ